MCTYNQTHSTDIFKPAQKVIGVILTTVSVNRVILCVKFALALLVFSARVVLRLECLLFRLESVIISYALHAHLDSTKTLRTGFLAEIAIFLALAA